MDFWYYVMTPFTWLLTAFYKVFNSYGLALIFFALVVKLILFPFSLKGKKSMIQMNMLSGKVQKLQKQYGKDQARYNEEVQKLYAKEGVNPMGGCLWSMLPLFILLPLYAIIRQPLKYMMGIGGADMENMLQAIAQTVNWSETALSMGWIKSAGDFVNSGYNQMYLASLINEENLEAVKTAVSAVGTPAKEIFCLNFNFFGANLARIPQMKFWADGLQGLGLFIIPVISAVTGLLFSFISLRTNKMNTQQNDQAAMTNKSMMFITPLMSLWIGFSMPAALSVYWVCNNVFGLGQELLCGKLLQKDYEKAAEAQRQREIEEKEEEKRLRREKAEAKARQAEENRKNKGKKPETDNEPKMTPEQRDASREGIRQYARGRAYDPARFGEVTAYSEAAVSAALQPADKKKKKSKKDDQQDS